MLCYCAKIRASLFKTHAVFGRACFRKMLIFETCLFKISIHFEALFYENLSYILANYCIQGRFMAQISTKIYLC